MSRLHIAGISGSTKARLAGIFFLLYAGTGGTGYFLSQSFVVAGNAAATAANILAAESTFRVAVAANLLSAACYLVMATFLYDVFRPVDRTLTRLAMLFLLVSCVIGAFDSLFQYAALDALQDGSLGVMSTPERQAIAFLLLKQHVRALDMGLVFFGFFWLTLGYLSLCSSFLPRIIAALALCNGLWYLAHLYRPLAAALLPYVMIVPGIGSIAVMSWLVIRGVDARRWNDHATIATRDNL